ncbi:MAG: hypothetical protein ACYTG0_29755, partial [Planctomycetota bacterium]
MPSRALHAIVTPWILLAAAFAGPPSAAAQRTSETDSRLKRGLERYPQADADGDGVLTEAEARAFLAKTRGRKAKTRSGRSYEIPPDHADVKYGPHDRNVLDLWLARRNDGKPTPLAIFIHGG